MLVPMSYGVSIWASRVLHSLQILRTDSWGSAVMTVTTHTPFREDSCPFCLYLCFTRSKLYVGTGPETKGCPDGSQHILLTSSCSESARRNHSLGGHSQFPRPPGQASVSLTLTYNAESSRKSFHAGKSAGPAIVYRVGSQEVRQESQMAPSHLPKGCLIQSGPGAVYDSNP